MSGGIGNDKGGKKAVQVESEVRLGLGLVSAVFRPLDAFGGQQEIASSPRTLFLSLYAGRYTKKRLHPTLRVASSKI